MDSPLTRRSIGSNERKIRSLSLIDDSDDSDGNQSCKRQKVRAFNLA
jgi:hypothetical protein